MASQLREVLNRFDDASNPVSLRQMAHELKIEPGVLQGMIDYWVRKGRLREISSDGQNCQTCGIKSACPFVVALPRYYERVAEDDDTEPVVTSPCECGGSCTH